MVEAAEAVPEVVVVAMEEVITSHSNTKVAVLPGKDNMVVTREAEGVDS